MFQSQPNRHISSRSTFFCTGGAKMWRFSGRMRPKTSLVKKKIHVQERHILLRNVTNVARHIFGHRKKWQMWRHSPKSETGTWQENFLRPTLKPENPYFGHLKTDSPRAVWNAKSTPESSQDRKWPQPKSGRNWTGFTRQMAYYETKFNKKDFFHSNVLGMFAM